MLLVTSVLPALTKAAKNLLEESIRLRETICEKLGSECAQMLGAVKKETKGRRTNSSRYTHAKTDPCTYQ